MSWLIGLAGVSGLGASIYGLRSAFIESGEIHKKKKDLIQSAKPFSKLNEDNTNVLVYHQNTILGCGIVEIYKKIVSNHNTLVVVNNEGKHTDLYGARTVETKWEGLYKLCNKLDMGLPKFIPPKNLANILFPMGCGNITYFGSSRDLTDYVKSVIGSDVIASDGEYKVNHRTFHNGERVFMYGRRVNKDADFECKLMGTSAIEIADVVHINESTDNGIKFVLSIGGTILSGMAIASLFNR
jgi:hypothetical protein